MSISEWVSPVARSPFVQLWPYLKCRRDQLSLIMQHKELLSPGTASTVVTETPSASYSIDESEPVCLLCRLSGSYLQECFL